MKNKFIEQDALYPEAKKLVKKDENLTMFEIQNALKIGFARTARLMDMLREYGVIKPKKTPTKVNLVFVFFLLPFSTDIDNLGCTPGTEMLRSIILFAKSDI